MKVGVNHLPLCFLQISGNEIMIHIEQPYAYKMKHKV